MSWQIKHKWIEVILSLVTWDSKNIEKQFVWTNPLLFLALYQSFKWHEERCFKMYEECFTSCWILGIEMEEAREVGAGKYQWQTRYFCIHPQTDSILKKVLTIGVLGFY